MLFEEDIEDIPEREQDMSQNPEDMMVDVLAQEEEEELNAMLAMLETSSPPRERLQPSSPALSDDDDYDSIFMDLISQQESSSQGFVSSGQMDMS